MTWYLYRRHDGLPEAVNYELPLQLFPGYALVSTSAEKPQVNGMEFAADGTLKPNTEWKSVIARAERDRRLRSCDWTQLPDVPLATRDRWATFRQALRDVPAQAGFPFSISWPVAPS